MDGNASETQTAEIAAAMGAPGNRWLRWLRNVPVVDPVDRRNAPALQIVLLLLGTSPAVLWLYRVVGTDIPWRPGEFGSMLSSLAVCAVSLLSFLLIRRGHFQWAIRQMLAVVAIAMIFGYAASGTAANTFERPLQVVWIALAGLMVGRRALWLMYGAVVLAYVAGAIHANKFSTSAIDTTANLAIMVVVDGAMFLFIAVVVDRGVKALHDALAAANQRGDALERANGQLQAEMEERQRAEQQLVHAQKVEAVGRLASGVAHDFNHLLGLILGYAGKGRHTDDSVELKSALAGVESAGRRANAVTRKLLDFSRHDATGVERFDVVAALRDIQPMLRQLFDPATRLVLALPEGPVPVEFDRAQLDLVLLNIAANANQAMPDGGRFEISLHCAGAFVEIALRDSGHGMDQVVQERLFEPFYTTRPRGGGTGLGLAVARQLVTAVGGDILAESAPGRGSTFRVRLPEAGHD